MSLILRVVNKIPLQNRKYFATLISGLSFFSGKFLADYLGTQVKTQSPIATGIINLVAFAVIYAVVASVYIYYSSKLAAAEEEIEKEQSTVSHARAICDRLIVHQATAIENAKSTEDIIESLVVGCTERIQNIIESAYSAFEAAYGKATTTGGRIDFEVTFMTKSFRDELVTIPAAANKDGRFPQSMNQRGENPKIYESTVTADIYRAQSPQIRIIESTHTEEYQELYPSQKDRLKSSIVFPVMSNKNRLLGTLVVHCDREYFFLKSKKKYWTDLLEIFSKRIAIEFLRIEQLQRLSKLPEINLQKYGTPPF
jgi:hypothetical protein